MIIYEPRETARWSTRDLAALLGKYVFVNIDGAETEGWVNAAGVDRYGFPYIDYRGGGTSSWHRDTERVVVSVHDAKPHCAKAVR